MLSIDRVESVVSLRTMQLGADEILVAMDVDLDSGLSDDDVEATVDVIEGRIKDALPSATQIYVELQSPQ